MVEIVYHSLLPKKIPQCMQLPIININLKLMLVVIMDNVSFEGLQSERRSFK